MRTSAEGARDMLDAYLREPLHTSARRTSVLRHLVRRALSPALAERMQVNMTHLLEPVERRRAARSLAPGARLHLGSGHTRLEQWINIDLVGYDVDLRWDITRGLPFPAGTVDAIFTEHVLEHLPIRAGLAVVEEAARVLRPGGILRVGVPDARRYAESYLQDGAGVIEEYRPGRPTPLLAMQEIYYRYGHVTMYDGVTLSLLCRAAGLSEIVVCDPGESRISPCPDSPSRQAETVYVEAVRT